jgi:phage terminase large subunit-like protein
MTNCRPLGGSLLKPASLDLTDPTTELLSDWKTVEAGLYLAGIEAEILRRQRRRIDRFFPDEGRFRRELYPKHTEFFRAGAQHRERLFMAGNRCGKTIAGAYEVALHLTGEYPAWWEGRRFDCPVDWWAAGKRAQDTRDIVQLELMGKWGEFGTGMIPGDALLAWSRKERPAHAVDTVSVRHVTGGVSSLGLKSYAEGAEAFAGTAKHGIWFDEECDLETYVEASIRTMIVPSCDAGGLCMVTFTPLEGWSDVVEAFLGSAEGVV